MVALAELGGLSAWADPPSHALSIVVKTGDTISGLTLTNVVCPVINDRGTIAFMGSFTGGSGIFTPSRVVAKTGDTISGLTLSLVSGPAINNRGTIVFFGFFSGGLSAIVRAARADEEDDE